MTTLIAYELQRDAGFELEPAPSDRAWMNATPARFANRCLPLLIANQSGWMLRNNAPVSLTWDGGAGLDAVSIDYLDATPPFRAVSHFGAGIVTWNLPYLFRTPPGYNLLVRGPANWIKDGIHPLEGVVETDWSPATFTLNWQLTRPGLTVAFDGREPLAMLVPQRRGELEEFEPEIRNLQDEPDTSAAHAAWRRDRAQFLNDLKGAQSSALRPGWQRHYFQGRMLDGSTAPSHQTHLRVRGFERTQPGDGSLGSR